MRALLPMDKLGLFPDTRGAVMANSLGVARCFGKRHDAVLRDIRELECSTEFNLHNFVEVSYRDERRRRQPCINMTRDGFCFLVMGYRGPEAAAWKEAYIKRFNELEAIAKSMLSARRGHRLLMQNVRALHDQPKPYHYTNECDMLLKLAAGMTARQLRAANGDAASARSCLSRDQLALLDALQQADVGLLLSTPDFHERKRILTAYRDRLAETFGTEGGWTV